MSVLWGERKDDDDDDDIAAMILRTHIFSSVKFQNVFNYRVIDNFADNWHY